MLDENKLLDYERKVLKDKVYFSSLNNKTDILHEIITELPAEFGEDATMSWKLASFRDKYFDAILGQNILRPLGAKIDMEADTMTINGRTIPFYRFCPYRSEEIYQLDSLVIDEKVMRHLFSNLNEQEALALEKCLNSFSDLIYTEGQILGYTDVVQHEIKTIVDKPIYTRIYRYPHIYEKEICNQIDDMLRQGIIAESSSPFNSPLWIVPKKVDFSGEKKFRIVVDYRKLNEVTVDDKFPIPNIENILDKLGRAQYFSTIDLAKGFHQILVRPEDRSKTAFSTPYGHYEFIRMPFGLKNAPATFQRLINNVLREFINKICVVYLDDILIFSTSFQEHVNNIRSIFRKLREANLKIQINKCTFFSKETLYLGHLLTTDGVKPNPSKVETILNLQLPRNVKGVKSFLSMAGFYRKFIKDFSKVAFPMIRYLRKGERLKVNDSNYINAFEKLKNILTQAPVLKYPDFSKPFQLATDASNDAIGAVLQQNGHPICYASRTLNQHERNYSATEKELLAIVWATKYFRPYLYGVKFQVLSDHQPLRWLFVKAQSRDLNPRLFRWMLSLGEFNLNVNYIRGRDNNVADFLSRINSDTGEIHHLDEASSSLYNNNDASLATVHSQLEGEKDYIGILDTVVNRFDLQIILTDNKTKAMELIHGKKRIYISSTDLRKNLGTILNENIFKGKVGIFTELNDHEYHTLQKKLIEVFGGNSSVKFVRCAYFAMDLDSEEETYRQIHNYHRYETGHTGIAENYEGLKRKIYFPNLKILIQKYINNCDTCNRSKFDRRPIKEKFKFTETPTDTGQIIHMDIYTNSKSNFLTFIDRFSKFATAYYLEDRTNQTIVEKLRLYKSQKGCIRKIITDNEFKSINIKDFLKNEGIELHLVKSNTHTGNADIERLHNTLSEKIRVLYIEEKSLGIKDKMSKAIEYYNNSFHSVTKEKPFVIEFGNCKKEEIYKRILENKRYNIEKKNLNRESITENRQMGFIKNYKSVRHKEQPKFRFSDLRNVHNNNIKREAKYNGLVNTSQYV